MAETETKDRNQAVMAAARAWAGAPAHVRALAKDYVWPIIEALAAVNADLEALRNERSARRCGECSYPACDCKGVNRGQS